jgi:amidase
MNEKELAYLSIAELGSQFRNKKLSAVEVTRGLLDRIRNVDRGLHSYLTVTEDHALRAAERADRELAAGHVRGPLHGVPIAVKDLCNTAGIPTTCASRILRDSRPQSNATVVDRLEAAGTVLLGKLNMTEFAVAWYHPELPVPLNPWGSGLWPGASSSGSGVATASGLCFGSLGSDTGGSIRFPSAVNGIVGLKPTWGRVSRYGVFPLGESLDHIGPMTRSVRDAALMLGAIAGADPNDPTSIAAPVEDYTAVLDRGVKGVRIGLDESYVSAADSEVATAVVEAARVLERLGAEIVKAKLPDSRPAAESWMTICVPETAAAHESTYPSRATDYGPGFRSFLELASSIRGQDYAKAHMIREGFANRFQEIFANVDVIACPSTPSAGFPADALPPDAKSLMGPNPLLRFTVPFNLSRNPTLSIPAGAAKSAAPPSLQLVGPRLGEAIILQVGEALERATEWHNQRPPV